MIKLKTEGNFSSDVENVILALDNTFESNHLLRKYTRQVNSFREYCRRRDEILLKKPSFIPLEFCRDCQILVKFPYYLRNLLISDDREFILFFLRFKDEYIHQLCINISNDLKFDELFIRQAVQANYQMLSILFPKKSKSSSKYRDREDVRYGNQDFHHSLGENPMANFINLNPQVLKLAKCDELDRDVILGALQKDIELCFSTYIDRDMALLIVEGNPTAIKYLRFSNDKEIILKAISRDKNLLKYASDSIIEDVLRKGELIEYSEQDVISLVLNAVKEKPSLFNFLPENLKENQEYVLKLISQNNAISDLIPDSLKQNGEFQLEWVKYDSAAFYSCKDLELRRTRQFLLNAIATYKFSLSSAPKTLQDDKEFVMECLRSYPDGFDDASSRLRDDEQVVELVLNRSDSSEFQYASQRLQDDKDFVMKHIEKCPRMYSSLSQRLKSDRDILLKCASGGLSGIIDSNNFFNDEEFFLELVERNARIVDGLSSISQEMARKCVERNGYSYYFLKSYNLIDDNAQLEETAALSSGYLVEKHSHNVKPTYGFKKVKTRTTHEDRENVELWMKKRLENQYDGLFIPLSSPMMVKGKFIISHTEG